MTTLDRFESLFRSAAKEQHEFEEYTITRAALVTDGDDESARGIIAEIERVFARLAGVEWTVLSAGAYGDPSELMARIQEASPDLLCSYRNLHTRAKEWPYSLGSYLDVMAQVTPMPVLVLPQPTLGGVFDPPLGKVDDVLVVTDHISGSGELVNVAARMVSPGGKLVLAHIEDDATFDRYARIMSMVPGIDTEPTVAALKERLLREARDYIESCSEALEGSPVGEVIEDVRMGHRVSDVRAMLDEHEVDLVVFSVKDDAQLAMHGLAYPLAIELRDVPVLMV